jgi:hypothetical protein
VVANSQQEKWEAVYGASLSGKKSLMFAEAEIVDFVSRSGKTRTLKETIQNKLMPIYVFSLGSSMRSYWNPMSSQNVFWP